eukprot:m.118637 g.118637  ORF g.118637 m.118637 type:complete len:199 (+) comp37654_c0_seq1:338-934(+)
MDFKLMLCECNVKILALSETKLDSSISDEQVAVKRFTLFRSDRSRHGGGVCLYALSSLQCISRLDLSTSDDPTTLETVSISINLGKGRRTVICCCYRPPSFSLTQFINAFTSLTENAYVISDDIIVLGDLNYNLTSDSSSPQAVTDLFLLVQLQNLVIQPTRVSASSSSLIDVILVSKPTSFSPSVSLDSSGSFSKAA